MKKLLCALLCGLLALSTSACTPDGSVYDTTNDTVRVWEYTYPSETTTTSPSTASTTTITTTTTAATSITHTTRTTVRATRRTAKKAATRAAVENDSNNESAQEPQSDTVYITPTGKRYHLLSTCGGKNSYAVSLDEALAKNLTPCKKCAS